MIMLDSMFLMPDFSSPAIWMSLLTLTFLEIVLGIDNIIFISIIAGKVEEAKRAYVTRVGLLLALVFRILLLFSISWIIALTKPWFSFEWTFLSGSFSGQSLVLIVGGIFLLYKATTEIGHKLGDLEPEQGALQSVAKKNLSGVLVQIILIDIVFSFDSILTAVGMTSGLQGALPIMIISVVIAILVMLLFAVQVGRFVNRQPTIQMLALSFLILIGFMLIAEGAHHAHLEIGDEVVGTVPKGYLYFAITFSLVVEFLNMKVRERSNKKYIEDQLGKKF